MYEEMKTFQITLTEYDIRIINQLLIEAPYKISAPIIQKFNDQIKEQEERLS